MKKQQKHQEQQPVDRRFPRRIAAGKIQLAPLHPEDLRSRMYRAFVRCPWLEPTYRMHLRMARQKVKFLKKQFKKRALTAETGRELIVAGTWYRAYARSIDAYNRVLADVTGPAMYAAQGDFQRANWLRLAISCHERNRLMRNKAERNLEKRLGSVRMRLNFDDL